MFSNEQKKYRLSVAILIVVSLLICIYLIAFSCFFSKKQIQSAMIPVKVYSQYEILDGGKVVYHLIKIPFLLLDISSINTFLSLPVKVVFMLIWIVLSGRINIRM